MGRARNSLTQNQASKAVNHKKKTRTKMEKKSNSSQECIAVVLTPHGDFGRQVRLSSFAVYPFAGGLAGV